MEVNNGTDFTGSLETDRRSCQTKRGGHVPLQLSILEALPFIDVPGGSFIYNREDTLPGIAFRGINEDYSESTGVLQQLVETTKIFGGKSKVDKVLAESRGQGADGLGIGAVRAVHDRLKAKAAALFFTKMFFDGNSGEDSRQSTVSMLV